MSVPPSVIASGNGELVHVEKAERFRTVPAVSRQSVSKLEVTGAVSPDVSRELPVLSLANGRVVALHVGLMVCVLLDSPRGAAAPLLGALRPGMNAPFASTSIREFWGCRYNLIVSRTLRDAVYQPILEASLVPESMSSMKASLVPRLARGARPVSGWCCSKDPASLDRNARWQPWGRLEQRRPDIREATGTAYSAWL